MKVDWYSEECCEECGETIHNHFDCPECKMKGAGTDAYFNLYEWFRDGPLEIVCENCGAEFEVLDVDIELELRQV